MVGFLGNALIGWELGQKGWLGVGMEGPRNKRVSFALFCFIGMILWQAARKLESPFTLWRDLWIPAWGILIFTVSYFLVPRSVRLYRRARLLHETSYSDNRLGLESGGRTEQLPVNERLQQAEALYFKALEIQTRLSKDADTDGSFLQYHQNIAATHLQLSLLYLQQQNFEKASDMAGHAIDVVEALDVKFPNNRNILSLLGDAFFRAAEAAQALGMLDRARAFYERSLAIDTKLINVSGKEITESRIRELDDRLARSHKSE